MGGKPTAMKEFIDEIKQRCVISKALVDTSISLNGCEVSQKDAGDITLSMQN